MNLREKYMSGDLFSVGGIVVDKKTQTIHEILSLGTNYVTVIDIDGEVKRKWISNLIDASELTEEFNSARRKRSSSNQIAFLGYKTKNFNEELYNEFKLLLKEFKSDKFTMLSLIRSVDLLIESSQDLKVETYPECKMLFDQTKKSLDKFGKSDYNGFLSVVEDKLMMHEITEGMIKFTVQDKTKIAHTIAHAVGMNRDDVTGHPHQILSKAAAHAKTGRYSPEAWKLMGKMFNMATSAGIKWDKNSFHPTTQKYMELK
jgi:hypothetical protein